MQLDDHVEETTPTASETMTTDEATTEVQGLYRIGFHYGHFIYRMRWLVIVLWVIALAISIPFAARVGTVLTGGGYNFKSSESVQVNNILTNTLHQPTAQALVVFQSTATPVSDPAFQQEISSFESRAKTFPHVTSVTSGGTGVDGRTALVVVSFNEDSSTLEHKLGDFHKLLPTGDSAGLAHAYVTGGPAISSAFTQITEQDTKNAEEAALPIALIVLLVVFGTLAAAVTPLILALVAVPIALALIYAIALHTETSVFVTNIASIVGLGISIDYSLFMTRRFRDELAVGRSVPDAVGWTVATAGEAILFSGLTVMIGFIGLILIGIQFMTSFGIGGAVVVAAAVLGALTLLPALLSVFGTRINSLRIPLLGRLTEQRLHDANGEERPGFWQKWALGVMRFPIPIVLGVLILLGFLGAPIFQINIGTPTGSALPTTTEARQGLDILNKQFPQTNQNPIYIIAQTPDGASILSADNVARVNALTQWLSVQPHVTNVTSLTQLPTTPGNMTSSLTPAQLEQLYSTGAFKRVPGLAQYVTGTTNGGTTLITVNSDTVVDSSAGKAQIDHLRAGDKKAAEGLTVYVGGFQATSLDFNRYLYDNFPKAIAFILVATFLLLLIMFRSLVLPLKAILVNIFSVSAAYGMLVYIFQQGHFHSLLGFNPQGNVDSIIPILLFCILFGLSMDYEVFLLSRISEEWQRTHDNRYAVARGLEKTGGVITNAALLFVIVTGAFTFTSVVLTKEMGLGMTIAVLVDATIIRSLLVPATMRLLGRWNWWLPGRPLPSKQSA